MMGLFMRRVFQKVMVTMKKFLMVMAVKLLAVLN